MIVKHRSAIKKKQYHLCIRILVQKIDPQLLHDSLLLQYIIDLTELVWEIWGVQNRRNSRILGSPPRRSMYGYVPRKILVDLRDRCEIKRLTPTN